MSQMIGSFKHPELESVKLTGSPPRHTTHRNLSIAVVVLSVLLTAAISAIGAMGYLLANPEPAVASTHIPQPFDVAMGVGVKPKTEVMMANFSTPYMSRYFASYAGTSREGLTIAAGINRITGVDGHEDYIFRTEIVLDAPFGEYATTSHVGRRTLRFVVVDRSGAQLIIIPFGLHAKAIVSGNLTTLRPNLFFLEYVPPPDKPPPSPPTSSRQLEATAPTAPVPGHWKTFVSTVSGATIASDPSLQASVNSSLNSFLHTYWKAALSAKAPSAASERALSESWAYEGGQVGQEAGSYVGNKVGTHFGSEIGSKVGGAVGGDVGEAAGGAIGGAVGSLVGPEGTAIGADIGSAVGHELGSYIGSKVGGDIGGELGGDAGSAVGGAVGQAAGQAIGGALQSSAQSSSFSYGG